MPSASSLVGGGWIFMSTYEEFMIILTACILLVSILEMKNKK